MEFQDFQGVFQEHVRTSVSIFRNFMTSGKPVTDYSLNMND